ncbi:MAG: alpha/beta fold hydrolase [Phenylobacterium sp.]|nr:alpha/beta fold hydrolase [Phenylobacterium sp.]
MATFTSDDLEIAFDAREPAPGGSWLILVHGFSSNRHEGWRRTGWYATLERRGMGFAALDQRGHGESAKPHDPALYGRAAMAGDVLALMDHLGAARADLFGYSMGARTALEVALTAPDRVSNLILGGVGDALFSPRETASTGTMAAAMRAQDPESITEPMLRSFRQFADEQGEDLGALAACTEAVNPPLDPDALAGLPMPVRVIAGMQDRLAGDPEGLARRFAYGKGVTLPGCDHFSAIPHGLTKAAVFDFLDGVDDDDPWGR